MTTDRQTFRETVALIAEKAKAKLPQAVNGRIESAVKLVLGGDVQPMADGSVTVYSATDPTRRYVLIAGGCTCQDFERGHAPDGWCQHRIAAGIAKRVHELLAVQAPAVVLPQAMEAYPDNDPEAAEAPRGAQVPTSPPSETAGAPAMPTALPEAPVSVNVRVLFAGHEVQWTLRGSDEAQVTERLQALLKRPDVRPLPKPAPKSGSWKQRPSQGR
jgi:hypothetical protein